VQHRMDVTGQERETTWMQAGQKVQKVARRWTQTSQWHDAEYDYHDSLFAGRRRKLHVGQRPAEHHAHVTPFGYCNSRKKGSGFPAALAHCCPKRCTPTFSSIMTPLHESREWTYRESTRPSRKPACRSGGNGLLSTTRLLFSQRLLLVPSNPTPPCVPNKAAPLSGVRGNLTTIRRYKDAANYFTETLQYDDPGNMVSHTDPCKQRQSAMPIALSGKRISTALHIPPRNPTRWGIRSKRHTTTTRALSFGRPMSEIWPRTGRMT
jgi:YD repeat-containing protein